jgi:GGDEF domain-containing protein
MAHKHDRADARLNARLQRRRDRAIERRGTASAGSPAASGRSRIADTPLLDGSERIAFTTSIGIAIMQEGDASLDIAMSATNRVLHRAKEGSRNRIGCA